MQATNGYTTIDITDAQSMAYDALQTASYRIGTNNYATAKHAWIKRGRHGKVRYSVTSEHAEVVEAMPKVLSGEITPEDALALLHQYDTYKQRIG